MITASKDGFATSQTLRFLEQPERLGKKFVTWIFKREAKD